jgi:hypothetical protein
METCPMCNNDDNSIESLRIQILEIRQPEMCI